MNNKELQEIDVELLKKADEVFDINGQIRILKNRKKELINLNMPSLFFGKFFKSDNGRIFFYCKKASPQRAPTPRNVIEEDFEDIGELELPVYIAEKNVLCDVFTFGSISTDNTFKKNRETRINVLKTEITREEYEEALERFKHEMSSFILDTRIVLFEKIEKIQ